ncbi:MAG: hypothetical protein AAFV59_14510 [Pseudomonadota bacterium]
MHLPLDPDTVKGFLDPEEGRALYEAAQQRAPHGPCLEIGGYCGKSALYLGTACAEADEILFSVDHHRGSEENQPGWEYFDPSVWDEAAQAVDTLPFFRETIRKAGLEQTVMDWYYVVLAGALPLEAARQRILDGWAQFVIEPLGCRCVSDEPWVTIAETAELVLALLAIGETERAAKLFAALFDYRDEAGVFWMGWQTREQIVWPREQPSWTQAAVILAADALRGDTPGSQLLTKPLL